MNTTSTQTNGKARGNTAAKAMANLKAVSDHMNLLFLERENVIEMLLTAAVGGEHMVMVGIPGTGKSAIAREFAACLGGDFYEYLFTAFSTPEEFIGPFSLKALEQDEYKRVLGGRFCDAHVVFADEIFKSNSASLNTLLPVLNERIVHNGNGVTSIPLKLCIGASNEMPKGEELGALWDRLLLRTIVEPLRSAANRRKLLQGVTAPSARPSLPLDQLEQLNGMVSSVTVDPGALEQFIELRAKLEGEGIVYGDRRWVKALKLVKANALVKGDTVADTYHMAVLKAVLWNSEDQRETVSRFVTQLAAPELQKAQALFDSMMEDIGKADASTKVEDYGAALHQTKQAYEELNKLEVKVGAATRTGQEIATLRAAITGENDRIKNALMSKYGKLGK